eukprot:15481275-Alexandrium_andersonii.AAC.1
MAKTGSGAKAELDATAVHHAFPRGRRALSKAWNQKQLESPRAGALEPGGSPSVADSEPWRR